MTIEEAIQILNLYDLGNTFLDIDGNPISPEKMASACDMAIDALRQQQPCEDAISRQAVLDVLCEASIPTVYKGKPSFIIDYVRVINSLPPVTPQSTRWIPVSESLPEVFQRVLVTIVNYNGDKVVRVAEYYNREGVGVFRIKENHEMWEVGEKGLLAWMPLPEPYKAESEE